MLSGVVLVPAPASVSWLQCLSRGVAAGARGIWGRLPFPVLPPLRRFREGKAATRWALFSCRFSSRAVGQTRAELPWAVWHPQSGFGVWGFFSGLPPAQPWGDLQTPLLLVEVGKCFEKPPGS